MFSACKAEPASEETTATSRTLTREIISLAKGQNTAELAKKILPAEESGVKRHAATEEGVKKILAGVDPLTVEFGPTYYSKEKSVIVVKIKAPLLIDLEYSIDPKTGKPAKLQALHP
ncbi:hypothetical protein GCM10023212_36640 [Luteolibacter yonseiensis]